MKFRLVMSAMLALLLLAPAPFASATITVPLITDDGLDSGWDAIIDENTTGILIDEFDPCCHAIQIEIFKNFTSFTQPNVIAFQQRLPDALAAWQVRINDETIRNYTGYDWTAYHWEVTGDAKINRSVTVGSNFSIAPFTSASWGNWVGDYADSLDVSGGIVPDGGIYRPGLTSGLLAIDMDMTTCPTASFSLIQYPIPEPATLCLLASGGVLLLRRKKK